MLSIVLLWATPCIYADQVLSAPTEKHEILQSSAALTWRVHPRIFKTDLLNFPEGTYKLIVMFTVDTNGNITQTRISSSSQLAELDHYIVTRVSKAKFSPYIKNGVARPFQVEQPYIIDIHKPKEWWKKLFGF